MGIAPPYIMHNRLIHNSMHSSLEGNCYSENGEQDLLMVMIVVEVMVKMVAVVAITSQW